MRSKCCSKPSPRLKQTWLFLMLSMSGATTPCMRDPLWCRGYTVLNSFWKNYLCRRSHPMYGTSSACDPCMTVFSFLREKNGRTPPPFFIPFRGPCGSRSSTARCIIIGSETAPLPNRQCRTTAFINGGFFSTESDMNSFVPTILGSLPLQVGLLWSMGCCTILSAFLERITGMSGSTSGDSCVRRRWDAACPNPGGDFHGCSSVFYPDSPPHFTVPGQPGKKANHDLRSRSARAGVCRGHDPQTGHLETVCCFVPSKEGLHFSAL